MATIDMISIIIIMSNTIIIIIIIMSIIIIIIIAIIIVCVIVIAIPPPRGTLDFADHELRVEVGTSEVEAGSLVYYDIL